MKWTDERILQLVELWPKDLTCREIAAVLTFANAGEVSRQARALSLPPRKRGRKPNPDAKTHTPYVSPQRRIDHAKPGMGRVLGRGHRAVAGATTLFPTTIAFTEDTLRILKSGHNQRKIGKRITKGAWRGFEVYCLTLIERTTCPPTCEHWLDCYGNNMPMAERILHDQLFEDELWDELEALQARHPAGYAVRLHILGDFYSVAYVRLWERALDAFPALHVFGFTRRWASEGAIGEELLRLATTRWDRFAMRFSGCDAPRGATTYKHGAEPRGIPCPAQTERTECCATCALCWSSTKTIAFESHGDRRGQPMPRRVVTAS